MKGHYETLVTLNDVTNAIGTKNYSIANKYPSASKTWYSCSRLDMLGGYLVCGGGCAIKTTFQDLPYHSSVIVSFTYIFGDSWDVNENERGMLSIDETLVWDKFPNNNFTSQACGVGITNSGWKTSTIDVITTETSHDKNSLTLTFTSSLSPADDEWLGVTRVTLDLYGMCQDENCLICSKEDFCTNCTLGMLLYDGKCVLTCPDDMCSNFAQALCESNFFLTFYLHETLS